MQHVHVHCTVELLHHCNSFNCPASFMSCPVYAVYCILFLFIVKLLYTYCLLYTVYCILLNYCILFIGTVKLLYTVYCILFIGTVKLLYTVLASLRLCSSIHTFEVRTLL